MHVQQQQQQQQQQLGSSSARTHAHPPLVLELARVPRVHRHRRAVHMQLTHDGAAAVQLWLPRRLSACRPRGGGRRKPGAARERSGLGHETARASSAKVRGGRTCLIQAAAPGAPSPQRLWAPPPRPPTCSLAQPQQADEDVLPRILIGQEGLRRVRGRGLCGAQVGGRGLCEARVEEQAWAGGGGGGARAAGCTGGARGRVRGGDESAVCTDVQTVSQDGNSSMEGVWGVDGAHEYGTPKSSPKSMGPTQERELAGEHGSPTSPPMSSPMSTTPHLPPLVGRVLPPDQLHLVRLHAVVNVLDAHLPRAHIPVRGARRAASGGG